MRNLEIRVEQIENGWVITSKSKSTYTLETRCFSNWPDTLEFIEKYLERIPIFRGDEELV